MSKTIKLSGGRNIEVSFNLRALKQACKDFNTPLAKLFDDFSIDNISTFLFIALVKDAHPEIKSADDIDDLIELKDTKSIIEQIQVLAFGVNIDLTVEFTEKGNTVTISQRDELGNEITVSEPSLTGEQLSKLLAATESTQNPSGV